MPTAVVPVSILREVVGWRTPVDGRDRADDPATTVEHERVIAAAIPGARHEVVGPAARVAAVEQPEAVNRLIREHLDA